MTVQEYKNSLKGEISVFLSLMTVILISFILAILDSAVIKTYGNMKKVNAQAAVFSVFGEYEDELFNDYGIFAVDSSYGKDSINEKFIEDKLRYFGSGDMDHKIEGIQLITDENCASFRSQALKYISDSVFDDNVSSFEGEKSKWQSILDNALKAFEKDGEYDSLLEDLKGSYKEGSEVDENAFEILEDSKNSSLVKELLPDGTSVSKRKVNKEILASNRKLNTGRGVKFDTSKIYSPTADISFNEYVLYKFKNVTNADIQEEGDGLLYEVEYILNGKDSDMENLEDTVEKLIFLRIIPNYEHIKNSVSKNSEVEALSAALSVAIANPELKDVISGLLKWMWAYTESKCDVSALMAGLKVPEMKTDETWHSGLYDCFTDNVTYNLSDCEKGLDYEGYLRVLLFAGKQEKITFHCIDMIELNICCVRENFRIDNCFVKISLKNKAELIKGFTYSFPLEFGYD